jgi:hypothetical protein
MTAWAKEKVEYFPLWLNAITIGAKSYLFVVALYLIVATGAAFFVGQASVLQLVGVQHPDLTLWVWAERITSEASIALFALFVLLTNSHDNSSQRREKIMDAIIIAMSIGLPQGGFRVGWALEYIKFNSANPYIAELANSVALAFALGLAAIAACYVLAHITPKTAGNHQHNRRQNKPEN